MMQEEKKYSAEEWNKIRPSECFLEGYEAGFADKDYSDLTYKVEKLKTSIVMIAIEIPLLVIMMLIAEMI